MVCCFFPTNYAGITLTCNSNFWAWKCYPMENKGIFHLSGSQVSAQVPEKVCNVPSESKEGLYYCQRNYSGLFSLRPDYLGPWGSKLLNTFENYFGCLTHSSHYLNSLSTVQREETFPSIDLKFICNLFQWNTLVFLFPLGKEWG